MAILIPSLRSRHLGRLRSRVLLLASIILPWKTLFVSLGGAPLSIRRVVALTRLSNSTIGLQRLSAEIPIPTGRLASRSWFPILTALLKLVPRG